MSSATFHAWIDAFFSNPYLAWGVGPVLGVNLGYWPLAFIMEWYVRLPSSRDQHVIWRGGNGDRLKDIEKTQDEIPIRTQVFGPYGCFFVLAGPAAIIGGLLSALIFTRLLGMEHAPASAVRFSVAARQLCVMEVVGDLFLYLGHRLLHEVPYLYRHFHVHHHQIHTPTALGTACIDSVDSTIQATLPIFAAAVAARPHPLVFSCYSGLRVAQNVMNHCGVEGSPFDHLFLRYSWLGRARAGHHGELVNQFIIVYFGRKSGGGQFIIVYFEKFSRGAAGDVLFSYLSVPISSSF
jgi:sterol desaturase/sphingolipid hydroxylase (fatty acid hydroxylase superfamily)